MHCLNEWVISFWKLRFVHNFGIDMQNAVQSLIYFYDISFSFSLSVYLCAEIIHILWTIQHANINFVIRLLGKMSRDIWPCAFEKFQPFSFYLMGTIGPFARYQSDNMKNRGHLTDQIKLPLFISKQISSVGPIWPPWSSLIYGDKIKYSGDVLVSLLILIFRNGNKGYHLSLSLRDLICPVWTIREQTSGKKILDIVIS